MPFPHAFTLKKLPIAALVATALMASLSAQAEVIKVAFIEVMSGPFAKTGEGSLNQLREVALQLNAKAKSGEPTFEIVPFDGKGSPQESVVALKSAVDQGIHYITQGGGSGVALALSDAIAKLAEREPEKAVVFLNYSAMDPLLTNERCNFWHFRFYPSSEMKIEALTTYLVKRPDVKKVFLFNQNYTHGQQVAKASRLYLSRKRPDVTIVGDDMIPIAQVRDFAPYVAKIKASGADTVITSNWGSDLTLFFKAAKEGGLNINFFTMNANNPGRNGRLGRRKSGCDLELGPQRTHARAGENLPGLQGQVQRRLHLRRPLEFAEHAVGGGAKRQVGRAQESGLCLGGHEIQEPDW